MPIHIRSIVVRVIAMSVIAKLHVPIGVLGVSRSGHCHSTDKEEIWKIKREYVRRTKEMSEKHVTTVTTAPALNPALLRTDWLTGVVKWFNDHRCFGFITLGNGGGDLYVHRSSIRHHGYQFLTQGEAVEFCIETGYDGRKEAVNVRILRSIALPVRLVRAHSQPLNHCVSNTTCNRLMLQTERLTGVVKRFSACRYGFIKADNGGGDVFVHHRNVKGTGVQSLREGEAVEFSIGTGSDGRKKAINVRILS